jgi:hypothetical protein
VAAVVELAAAVAAAELELAAVLEPVLPAAVLPRQALLRQQPAAVPPVAAARVAVAVVVVLARCSATPARSTAVKCRYPA